MVTATDQVNATSMTMEAWVNLESLPGGNSFAAIASTFDGSGGVWEWGFGGGAGSAGLYFGWLNGSYSDYAADGLTYPTGVWFHVAMRLWSTTAYDFVFMGRQITKTSTGNSPAIATGSRKLRIKGTSDNANTFAGSVANFRMHRGVLSLHDLQRSMLSASMPADLWSRAIVDLPLSQQMGGSSTVWALDQGPLKLGALTMTGTVVYTGAPPLARYAIPRQVSSTVVASAAASLPLRRSPYRFFVRR